MADPQLFSDYDFWMGVRQHLFGVIALIEKRLGRKPTTKERLDQWKQRDYDATHIVYPDYEVDETQ